MRRPFGRLMEMVDDLDGPEQQVTLGELSRRWGEPIERIIDAIDALKVLYGEPTYIGAAIRHEETDSLPELPPGHPFVRLDYPGGKDGLCAVQVDGDFCLRPERDHAHD